MPISIMEQLKKAKQSTEEAREKMAKLKEEKRQYENRLARLQQTDIQRENKKRTHRLIQRGAILEKVIDGADRLTNEQIQELVYAAFSTDIIADMLNKMYEQR